MNIPMTRQSWRCLPCIGEYESCDSLSTPVSVRQGHTHHRRLETMSQTCVGGRVTTALLTRRRCDAMYAVLDTSPWCPQKAASARGRPECFETITYRPLSLKEGGGVQDTRTATRPKVGRKQYDLSPNATCQRRVREGWVLSAENARTKHSSVALTREEMKNVPTSFARDAVERETRSMVEQNDPAQATVAIAIEAPALPSYHLICAQRWWGATASIRSGCQRRRQEG